MPSLNLASLSCASGHEVSSQIIQQGLGVCRGKVHSALDRAETFRLSPEREEGGSFWKGLEQLQSFGSP